MTLFDHHHYVPCLRWKMGEYQAVAKLSGVAKKLITPLIEVPEIGWDFGKSQPAKTVDKLLEPFAKRVKIKWGERYCFVDLKMLGPHERMADNTHPLQHVFTELRVLSCAAIPVTGISRDKEYQKAVKNASRKDKNGLCVRVSLEEAALPSLNDSIKSLLEYFSLLPSDCDFVLDLGSPNFVPVDGFTTLVRSIYGKIPNRRHWRSLTIIGSSFPSTMAEIEHGLSRIPRYEWQLYAQLVEKLIKDRERIPTFGDYTINHPDPISLDMRLVKPSATIRYTTDNSWVIVKGPNVRDNGFEQYQNHCKALLRSSDFAGAGFSEGDQYIKSCALGTSSTGNLTVWRRVGTNHHLQKIVNDVAKMSDS